MKTIFELNENELSELIERYIIELDLDHDNISFEEVRQYYKNTLFTNNDFKNK
jgi:hypothetical protein